MIGLAVLVGGVLLLAAWQLFGQGATVAIAGAAFALVLVGVASDAWRVISARRTAYRRWRQWQRTDTDSLERAMEQLDG